MVTKEKSHTYLGVGQLRNLAGHVGQEDYSRHVGEMEAAIHDSFGPNGGY